MSLFLMSSLGVHALAIGVLRTGTDAVWDEAPDEDDGTADSDGTPTE